MYLSELTNMRGVSGDEKNVRNYIKNLITPYCDRIEIDSIGNLLAFKSGTQDESKTLMVCAHMDEVGMIVTRITEEGFLKFKQVGYIDPRRTVSKRVLVGDDCHSGVIGRKAIHLLTPEERKKAAKTKDLYIDIGAKNKKDAEKRVSPGDYVTFDSHYVPFGEGLVKAKAIDNRAACSLLLELIQEPCPWNVCFAFTVQEEVGTRGAKICSRRVKPDFALVLDSTISSDIPGTDKPFVATKLGAGAVLTMIDGATSYNRDRVQKLYDMAAKKGIAVQIKQTAAGGNDAGAVHLEAGGIPTLSVSIPTRYMHSPSSVMSLSDYEAAREVTRLLIQEVDHV